MTITVEYKGYKITLNEGFKFVVEGADIVRASMEEVREAIDLKIRRDEAQNRAAKRIAESMLADDGKPITLRGIHATTGYLLTDRKDYTGNIFPMVPVVKALLEERVRLEARLDTVKSLLRSVTVSGRSTYGRLNPERYESYIASLMQDVARVREAAKQLEQPATEAVA